MVKETSLIFVSRKVIYIRTPKWTLERASSYLICIHSNFFVLRLVTKLLKNARQLHTIHVPRENIHLLPTVSFSVHRKNYALLIGWKWIHSHECKVVTRVQRRAQITNSARTLSKFRLSCLSDVFLRTQLLSKSMITQWLKNRSFPTSSCNFVVLVV